MRNFSDVWNVIWDDNARPLIGKIAFLDPNTQSYKSVYSVDGIPLSNPIYVNKVPTHQIMLGEGDYSVAYYRYIGNGNMDPSEDTNEESWLLYKTTLVTEDSISNVGITVSSATTISELQNISGMKNGDVVEVIGYYASDDCPARYYVWKDTVASSDGGIIISSNKDTSGHWEMKIPQDYIDVRWYGDIAEKDNAGSQHTSSLGQRARAAAAANSYHKHLYMSNPNPVIPCYYFFDGSNSVSVNRNILVDNSVYFVIKEDTTGNNIQCKQLIKDDVSLFTNEYGKLIGGYKLVSDWVNTSWIYDRNYGDARRGYIVDVVALPWNFSDCQLKIQCSLPDNSIIDNCEIIEGKHFVEKGNHIQMGNMTLDSDYFATNYDYNYVRPLEGLKIDITKCDSADNYILLKNLIGEYDYGDLREMELHNAKINGSNKTILENCSGSVEIIGHGDIELHNAAISIKGANSSDSITSLDSWMTFDNTSVVGNLTLLRGSLSGNFQILNAIIVRDADIHSTLALNGLSKLEIVRCHVSGTLNIVGHENYKILSNVFQSGSAVTHTFDANVGNGTYDGNIIEAGSEGWAFSSNVANTTVNVSWTNNTSFMTSHFISLDRTNFVEDDITHGYVYKNNNGRFAIKDTTEMEVIGYFTSKQNPPADTLAVIRKGDASVTYWEANILNWWNNTSNGKVINPTMFIVGKKADVIVDFQCYPSANYPSRLKIHGNNFVIDTRKAVIGVTWNTANSFKLDTGTYRSIFIINGTGSDDYDMMEDTNTRWKLKLDVVR